MKNSLKIASLVYLLSDYRSRDVGIIITTFVDLKKRQDLEENVRLRFDKNQSWGNTYFEGSTLGI